MKGVFVVSSFSPKGLDAACLFSPLSMMAKGGGVLNALHRRLKE